MSARGHALAGAKPCPELTFIADCCHRCFFTGTAEDEAEPPEPLSWKDVLPLARFHRVQGLVFHGLAAAQPSVPQGVREALGSDAAIIAARNLQAAAECRDLRELFAAADIPLLFLKGLTLGALAYGNPALKAAVDIDLLIDPTDLPEAGRLLAGRGYRLVIPKASPDGKALRQWHVRSKESVWVKESPPLQIDLHTRPADNPALIPALSVNAATQLVDVGSGIQLPTFAREELFAYLAVHGASSAWFRLKWIADFAALVNGGAAGNIERLFRRSQQLGAGRAAGQALLLSDTLFGTLSTAPALRDELHRDPMTRRLVAAAWRLLTRECGEPTDRAWGTLPIHWTQLLLLPGISFKLGEVSRQAGAFLRQS